MNWTQANLQSQFNHATANGWIALFTDIATSAGFPVEFVLAIASRETNMLNIKGDFHDGIYHGFGIMQVDVGDRCRVLQFVDGGGRLRLDSKRDADPGAKTRYARGRRNHRFQADRRRLQCRGFEGYQRGERGSRSGYQNYGRRLRKRCGR